MSISLALVAFVLLDARRRARGRTRVVRGPRVASRSRRSLDRCARTDGDDTWPRPRARAAAAGRAPRRVHLRSRRTARSTSSSASSPRARSSKTRTSAPRNSRSPARSIRRTPGSHPDPLDQGREASRRLLLVRDLPHPLALRRRLLVLLPAVRVQRSADRVNTKDTKITKHTKKFISRRVKHDRSSRTRMASAGSRTSVSAAIVSLRGCPGSFEESAENILIRSQKTATLPFVLRIVAFRFHG